MAAAHHDERDVHQQAHEGEQHRRADDHEHVVGGEPAKLGDGREDMPSVGKEHLVKPFGPAHALLDGRLELDGLLVIELGRGVRDADAVGGAERGELDVLREGVEVPAVHALDDLLRTRDSPNPRRRTRCRRSCGRC